MNLFQAKGSNKTFNEIDVSTIDSGENLSYKISTTKKKLLHAIFLDSKDFHYNISHIIQETNSKILNNATPKELKIFYGIFVEILENIYRHAIINLANGIEARQSEFIFEKLENDYTIKIINHCAKEDYQKLQNLSLQINNADLKEITELYKQQCINGKISDKGGAGLGLFTIAKTIRRLNPDKKFDIITINLLKEGEISQIEIIFNIPNPTK